MINIPKMALKKAKLVFNNGEYCGTGTWFAKVSIVNNPPPLSAPDHTPDINGLVARANTNARIYRGKWIISSPERAI